MENSGKVLDQKLLTAPVCRQTVWHYINAVTVSLLLLIQYSSLSVIYAVCKYSSILQAYAHTFIRIDSSFFCALE